MFNLTSASNIQLATYAVFIALFLCVVVVRVRACWEIRNEFYDLAKRTNEKNHAFRCWLKHCEKRVHYSDLIAELLIISVICYLIL